MFYLCLDVQLVATEIKGLIEDFKPYIPLIQGLRNPGMRSRHWDQVSINQSEYRKRILFWPGFSDPHSKYMLRLHFIDD